MTTEDEMSELSEALERRRCISIAEAVGAEMVGFTNPPFTAGFAQACEEIAYRIEHEKWVFQDVDGRPAYMPAPKEQA